MIQVMRTSRGILSYFSGKHLLVLSSMGIMALLLRATNLFECPNRHIYIPDAACCSGYDGARTCYRDIYKNQFYILGIGSFFNMLSIIVLCRMALPTWNIPKIPFNPFNELIRGYYDLFYPLAGGTMQLNLVTLTLFAVGFYLVCAALFHKLTYKNGFML